MILLGASTSIAEAAARLGSRTCRLPFSTALTTSAATFSRGTAAETLQTVEPLERLRRRSVFVGLDEYVGGYRAQLDKRRVYRQTAVVARSPAVKCDSAALDAEYVTSPGYTPIPASDDTLTIWPPSATYSIRGITCRHSSAGAR